MRKESKKLAVEVEDFIDNLPLTANRKVIALLRGLADNLHSRHAGGLRWALDTHMLNFEAWKKVIGKEILDNEVGSTDFLVEEAKMQIRTDYRMLCKHIGWDEAKKWLKELSELPF